MVGISFPSARAVPQAPAHQPPATTPATSVESRPAGKVVRRAGRARGLWPTTRAIEWWPVVSMLRLFRPRRPYHLHEASRPMAGTLAGVRSSSLEGGLGTGPARLGGVG